MPMCSWNQLCWRQGFKLKVLSSFCYKKLPALVSEHVLHPFLKVKPDNLFISHHVLSLYWLKKCHSVLFQNCKTDVLLSDFVVFCMPVSHILCFLSIHWSSDDNDYGQQKFSDIWSIYCYNLSYKVKVKFLCQENIHVNINFKKRYNAESYEIN